MSEILFYEKPGCVNNRRQKALLSSLGHQVIARDLLRECWTPQRLAGFFGDLPPAAWFNPTAPRIASGEIDPSTLGREEALRAMCLDPLLIRRPLIESAYGRTAGFDDGEVLAALGVRLAPDVDLQTCPRVPAGPACEPPGGAA